MEFRKARFAKRSDRYPRNERTQGEQGSRSGGSRYGGNECEIPFKPKDSRPVYCRECFQNHKPQEPSVSGFNRNDRGSRYGRDSGGGSRYSRDSGGSSRYGRDSSSKFEKDRTPIHGRDSF